jgi:hypothetical protein
MNICLPIYKWGHCSFLQVSYCCLSPYSIYIGDERYSILVNYIMSTKPVWGDTDVAAADNVKWEGIKNYDIILCRDTVRAFFICDTMFCANSFKLVTIHASFNI